MKINLEVQGIGDLGRKAQQAPEEVIAEPWSEAMESIGALGEAFATRAAPIGSGRTVALMYHRTQSKPIPLWTRVGTHAKRQSRKYPRGYAYPRRLNFDPNSRYKGWFDKAMEATKRAAQQILDKAARKMERRWNG